MPHSANLPLNRSRVILGTVWPRVTPGPVPFYELSGLPVRTGRISCSIELLIEVLFSFPLRYLFAIGYHAFIFSLGWPAPPIFSQHSQADLLAGQSSPDSVSPGRVERPVPWVLSPCAANRVRISLRPSDYRSRVPVRGPRIRSRAYPSSLAVTKGISVDFFSSAD